MKDFKIYSTDMCQVKSGNSTMKTDILLLLHSLQASEGGKHIKGISTVCNRDMEGNLFQPRKVFR